MFTDPFAALEDEPRWVAWREEARNGKPTEVPYSPQGGRASVTDPATWGTRHQAQTRAEQLVNGAAKGGIGIALGDIGDATYLCAINFDSCLDHGGIPFMITGEMREQLLAAGYSPDAIREIEPQQAVEIIWPHGRLAPRAREILDALDTYSEISSSGDGLTAFFYADAEDVRPFLDRISVGSGKWGCRRGIPGDDDDAFIVHPFLKYL